MPARLLKFFEVAAFHQVRSPRGSGTPPLLTHANAEETVIAFGTDYESRGTIQFKIAVVLFVLAMIALPARLEAVRVSFAANTYWLSTNTDFPSGFSSFSTKDDAGLVSWYASIRVGKFARSFFVSFDRSQNSNKP